MNIQGTEIVQTLVALVILAGLIWAIRKHGQNNPVSTRQIEHDLNGIKMKMQPLETLPREFRHAKSGADANFHAVEGQLRKMVTTEAMMHFEHEIDLKMEKLGEKVVMIEERVDHLATKADVGRVEESIKHVCRQADATDQSIVRIEQHLLGNSRGRGR